MLFAGQHYAGLITWLFWLQCVVAIDPSILELKLNDGLARMRLVLYGSIVTITGEKKLSTWTDGKIVDLAFTAHAEVKKLYQDLPKSKKYKGLAVFDKPAMTSVFAVDDTAYITTSLKGGPYLYLAGTAHTDLKEHPSRKELTDALKACQSAAIKRLGEKFGKGHRSGGSCAEIMAALAYVQSNGGVMPPAGARVVTVTTDEYKGGSSKDVIRTPCSKPDEKQGSFGCQQFLQHFGDRVQVIPDNTAQEAIGDIDWQDVAYDQAEYP